MQNMTEQRAFSELSGTDQQEVMRLYYETDIPVADIISRYNLTHKPGRLTKEFPLIDTGALCPYCGISLLQRRPTRTSTAYRDYQPECPECGHGKREPCRCRNCKVEAERIAAMEEAERCCIIQAEFPNREIKPDYFPQTMREAVALVAADRHTLDEFYENFFPTREQPLPYGPTWEVSKDFLMVLFASGIMQVDQSSDPDAFIFEGDMTIKQFYPMKCKWRYMPINEVAFRRHLINSTVEALESGHWPAHWEQELDQIWHGIVLAECVSHFELLHWERNLPFSRDEPKTIDTIIRGLKKYSPAQISNLCWQSARDTVDYMVKNEIPSRSAQNVSRAILARKIDKAIVDGWKLKPSVRDRRLPRSAVSHVFFDVVTGFGEGYFREVAPAEEAW